MNIDNMEYFIRNSIFSLLLTSCLLSCDDGKIYPKETEEVSGGKATINVRFTGQDAWPSEYMLLFAAFGDDEEMPVVSKIISRPSSEDEEVSVTLNGLDERTKRITVTVANKGRQPLYHFYSYPLENTTEETILPVETINLATYDRIQHQVYNNYCIACHGAGDHAAADLYLTENKSYEATVNVPAPLSSTGKMLVKPGLSSQSFLVDILTNDTVNYNHTDVLPEDELITLIKTWINDGAQK